MPKMRHWTGEIRGQTRLTPNFQQPPMCNFHRMSLGSCLSLLATDIVFGRRLKLILAVLAAEVERRSRNGVYSTVYRPTIQSKTGREREIFLIWQIGSAAARRQ